MIFKTDKKIVVRRVVNHVWLRHSGTSALIPSPVPVPIFKGIFPTEQTEGKHKVSGLNQSIHHPCLWVLIRSDAEIMRKLSVVPCYKRVYNIRTPYFDVD